MGEGMGGGGQNREDFVSPSPSSSPTEGRGDFWETFQRKLEIDCKLLM
jgi:hypothetical protein